MEYRKFSLIPFQLPCSNPFFTINCAICQADSILRLFFFVSGPIHSLDLPSMAKNPSRREGLWRNTCFECFLSPLGEKNYWEFNFSPSGDWNVYAFTGYRKEIAHENNIPEFLIKREEDATFLTLSVAFDKTWIIHPHQYVDLGLSAILKRKDGKVSYHALTHLDSEPDFHRRESFLIRL